MQHPKSFAAPEKNREIVPLSLLLLSDIPDFDKKVSAGIGVLPEGSKRVVLGVGRDADTVT